MAAFQFQPTRSDTNGASMPTAPDVPSAAMLTQIAADYGIDLTAAEADFIGCL